MKKDKLISLIVLLLFVVVCRDAISQVTKKSCLVIDTVFNSGQFKSRFHKESNKDSFFVLDKSQRIVENCHSFYWGNKKVQWITDTAILNKVLHSDPYYLFKNDCATFIVDEFKRKGKKYYVTILQPCSSITIEAIVNIHEKRATVTSFKWYVL